MSEPVKVPRLDDTLRLFGNGKLPGTLLRPIKAGGRLYIPAALAFDRMFAAAEKDGIVLKSVSAGYRSFERQEAMFFERYSKLPTLRRPQVTRKYQGKTWWLKRGKSPSATPGKSNHGWGLSQDLEVPAKTYRWLCANAPRFGFYMEAPRSSPNFEAWHWVYCDLK